MADEIDLMNEEQRDTAGLVIGHMHGIKQALKNNDIVTAMHEWADCDNEITAFSNFLMGPERWTEQFYRMINVYYDQIAILGKTSKDVMDLVSKMKSDNEPRSDAMYFDDEKNRHWKICDKCGTKVWATYDGDLGAGGTGNTAFFECRCGDTWSEQLRL